MNRKEFTKKCLADSLIQLLETKEYYKITINDITEKSGFSRMSYYRNFGSIDEILDYYITDFTDNFIQEEHINYEEQSLKEYLVSLFYRLQTPTARKLTELLIKRDLMEHVRSQFTIRYQEKSTPENVYFFTFLSGGIFSTYKEWATNGFKDTPEQVVEIILKYARGKYLIKVVD